MIRTIIYTIMRLKQKISSFFQFVRIFSEYYNISKYYTFEQNLPK